MDGYKSTRYELPPDVEPRWFGELLGWVPAIDVTVELVGGGERSGLMIGPDPTPDPATGQLAIWFMVPGKLDFDPVAVKDIAAFTVHRYAPPEPESEELSPLGWAWRLITVLVWHLPKFVFELTTGRLQTETPEPELVTEEDPVYTLIEANGQFDGPAERFRNDMERAVEAALRELTGLSDHAYLWRDDGFRVQVMVRAPNGIARHAAIGAAMDAVTDVFPSMEALPGVTWLEIGVGDW